LRTKEPVIPQAAASEETATTQTVLAFDDNRFASVLFGQYGQNLALIERRLGVVADSRGNHVTLEGSRAGFFKNTFADIEYILTTCAGNNTRFEIECYDIGHLYTLRHFLDRGLVKPPLFVQSVFGILGGIGPHPEDVLMMKRTADRLFGDQYHWSVLGAGQNQMRVAAQAAAMGGNVRVGMEDSLWIGAGRLAESNAQQVTQVRKILEGLGLEIASPDEAREILSLKGGDKVGF